MGYSIAESIPQQAAHHESIEALWNLVWKKRCGVGIYPFMEAKLEDFEGIFAQLIEMNLRPPYDFEKYSQPFFPVAEDLDRRADTAEAAGDLSKACQLYMRAAAVYRIARFPTPQSPRQRLAWERQKAVFLKGAKLLDPPISEHQIPHTHGLPSTTEAGSNISICARIPSHSVPTTFPTIIQIYGLDGYRTEFTRKSTDHIACGWASIAVEIPGTADCPASINDPESPERLWSSVLDWLKQQEWVDKKKVVVWGVSTGGYYAVRIAHTHKDRLAAVVAQGAGCHLMFEPEWLEMSSHLDYPFDLTHCLALKFGYDDVEAMKKDSQKKFSLLDNGILDQSSTKLLLVNGMNDQIFPIEDSILALQHGSVKEARLLPGLQHMGEPVAGKIIAKWLEEFYQTIR